MEWQPIETYDALPVKKRPKWAVFYVEAKKPDRPGGFGLSEQISTTRYYGSRNITHWMPLPNSPVKEAQHDV